MGTLSLSSWVVWLRLVLFKQNNTMTRGQRIMHSSYWFSLLDLWTLWANNHVVGCQISSHSNGSAVFFIVMLQNSVYHYIPSCEHSIFRGCWGTKTTWLGFSHDHDDVLASSACVIWWLRSLQPNAKAKTGMQNFSHKCLCHNTNAKAGCIVTEVGCSSSEQVMVEVSDSRCWCLQQYAISMLLHCKHNSIMGYRYHINR